MSIIGIVAALMFVSKSSLVKRSLELRPGSSDSWRRQFELLLWKNMLIRRRSIGSIISDLAVPLVLSSFTVVMSSIKAGDSGLNLVSSKHNQLCTR